MYALLICKQYIRPWGCLDGQGVGYCKKFSCWQQWRLCTVGYCYVIIMGSLYAEIVPFLRAKHSCWKHRIFQHWSILRFMCSFIPRWKKQNKQKKKPSNSPTKCSCVLYFSLLRCARKHYSSATLSHSASIDKHFDMCYARETRRLPNNMHCQLWSLLILEEPTSENFAITIWVCADMSKA